MYDKSSERVMSALVEAQGLVKRIAEPSAAGESVKAAIGRASRKLRWNFNRVRSIWYADPRTAVSGDELNQLRQAAGQHAGAHRGLAEKVEQLEQQIRALQARFPQDADFYGAQADSLRDALGHARRLYHSER